MLLQLRDFIAEQGLVSIQQLTREFSTDEESLQPLLRVWINRGYIQKNNDQVNCKTACSSCKKVSLDHYEYVIDIKK